jgi:hypothetical protein
VRVDDICDLQDSVWSSFLGPGMILPVVEGTWHLVVEMRSWVTQGPVELQGLPKRKAESESET